MRSHNDSNHTQNSSLDFGRTRTSEGRARLESQRKCHNETVSAARGASHESHIKFGARTTSLMCEPQAFENGRESQKKKNEPMKPPFRNPRKAIGPVSMCAIMSSPWRRSDPSGGP
eukprot:5139277-Prymnesium_polylepis.2